MSNESKPEVAAAEDRSSNEGLSRQPPEPLVPLGSPVSLPPTATELEPPATQARGALSAWLVILVLLAVGLVVAYYLAPRPGVNAAGEQRAASSTRSSSMMLLRSVHARGDLVLGAANGVSRTCAPESHEAKAE